MEKTKIAIIDDHELFREGIKLVLNQIEGFEVIFDTDNGYNFLDFLDKQKPDIVLMDIQMPQINGIETAKVGIKKHNDLKIIALTMFSDLNNFNLMINAGAKGFILKSADKIELNNAINSVISGVTFFSRQILQKMAFQNNKQLLLNQLTNREFEILQKICNGLTSKEIADELFISLKTVETHRTNLFQKAAVRNAAELIVWAVKNDFFSIK